MRRTELASVHVVQRECTARLSKATNEPWRRARGSKVPAGAVRRCHLVCATCARLGPGRRSVTPAPLHASTSVGALCVSLEGSPASCLGLSRVVARLAESAMSRHASGQVHSRTRFSLYHSQSQNFTELRECITAITYQLQYQARVLSPTPKLSADSPFGFAFLVPFLSNSKLTSHESVKSQQDSQEKKRNNLTSDTPIRFRCARTSPGQRDVIRFGYLSREKSLWMQKPRACMQDHDAMNDPGRYPDISQPDTMLLCLLMAHAGASGPAPGVIRFTRLWISHDGLTHLQDCTVQQMTKKPLPGGKTAQYVRSLEGIVDPSQLIFTQMAAGSKNPWHQCPTSQFVIPLSGSWFVNSSSGDYAEFGPGDVLFQDDYVGLSINGTSPVHFSGAVGAGPCNQLVISATSRKATVDDRSCDWARQFEFPISPFVS